MNARDRNIAYREHLRVEHKLHRSDKRRLTDADIADFALSRTGWPPKHIHCEVCTTYAVAVGFSASCEVGHLLDSNGHCVPCETFARTGAQKAPRCSAGHTIYLAHCEYCTVLQMELSGELSPVRISEFA